LLQGAGTEQAVHLDLPLLVSDGFGDLQVLLEVELCGGVPHPRWSLEIVCFDVGRKYDCDAGEEVIKVVTTASLAGGRTDGVASFAGWQIFGAAGEYDNSDCRVRVNIAAGARDTQAFLEQISFHLHVLAKVNE
jgi:hypothetical protein